MKFKVFIAVHSTISLCPFLHLFLPQAFCVRAMLYLDGHEKGWRTFTGQYITHSSEGGAHEWDQEHDSFLKNSNLISFFLVQNVFSLSLCTAVMVVFLQMTITANSFAEKWSMAPKWPDFSLQLLFTSAAPETKEITMTKTSINKLCRLHMSTIIKQYVFLLLALFFFLAFLFKLSFLMSFYLKNDI